MQEERKEASEGKQSIRDRWRKGFFGSFAYFTDHVIFRFNQPVDWLAAHVAEEWGYPYLSGTEAEVLSQIECRILKLMAQGLSEVEMAQLLGLPEMTISDSILELKRKLPMHRPGRYSE